MGTTVLDKLLADCERAYRSKYPVIFIQTEEMEMVRRVVASNRLVVRMKIQLGADQSDKRYVPCPAERQPYVRHVVEPEALRDSVNVFISGQLSYTDAVRMPRMAIQHVSDPFPSQLLPYIMDFVDRYLCSEDNNGALRNSLYLLYGDASVLPAELQAYCAIIDVDLPDLDELYDLVEQMMVVRGLQIMTQKTLNDIAYQLLGFTAVQAEHILEAIFSMPDADGINAIYSRQCVSSLIQERKEQFLKRGRLLELKHITDDDAEIGGMECFKEWFETQAPCIIEAGRLGREAGVAAPRGILMCGVPGCGKSMAAKAVARRLKKPLLQMDVGNLMGSLLGDSERNMDQALKLAEAMSPCVLWIDELDKGFSEAGQTGNSGDSGVFRRMFGKLLTWMQESRKPCFIFATANDITGLPKEFFRSGRFDELFAVYMPLHKECTEILHHQMKRLCKRAQSELFTEECWAQEHLKSIISQFIYREGAVEKRRFVTGADIEKLVGIAMRTIWREGGAPSAISARKWSLAILEALRNTTVYGDGPDNLDSIAVCYIRLLRNSFSPSAQEKLFSASDYAVESDETGSIQKAGFQPKTEEELKAMHAYDRALYETLQERICRLAPLFEQNMRARIVR